MIFSAILSFLGGSAFRMIWGEISSYVNKRQDQAHEVELLEVQAKLDAAQHERNLAAIRLQADLGIKTIGVQAEADTMVEEARAFREAVANAMRPSGIRWVDAWNAAVRPAYATVCLALWMLILYRADFRPTEWDLSMMAMVAGFFFADRSLSKRGK